MTITMDLPRELERRLRAEAQREGRPVNEYVQGLIESRLELMPVGRELLLTLDRGAPSELLLEFFLAAAEALTQEPASHGSPLDQALRLYGKGVVTLEVGAELAGTSQREFVDALGRAKIPVFQYSAEEAIADADLLCRAS